MPIYFQRAFLELRSQQGFADFLWQFVDAQPLQNQWRSVKQVPSSTAESEAMSKEPKRRGFTFVGSTICYVFVQAIGMVNDHTTDCFRHAEIKRP